MNNKNNLVVVYKKVNDLIPYINNTRTHDDKQINQIASSIKEFGFTNPILIDEDNGVIAGHGRILSASKLGLDSVPTILLSGLSKAQKKAYIIADNKLALNAGWNEDLLKLELQSLKDMNFDISLTGFELDEINFEEETIGLTDEDTIPEEPKQIVSVLGDIWSLGRHRLMCGDSTSIDNVDKLMDGNTVDMVFTDPPYGINHSGKGISSEATGNDFGKILGDKDINVAVDSFNLANKIFGDKTLIFWGANYYCSSLPNGFGWLVWDKEREGNTFSGAELAFVNKGVRLDIFRHKWHGMIKASEHGQKRVHPTQKPVALAEWCFNNYDNPSNILDLFGGSGSTLIACEKNTKTAFIMELDEKYIDVIIKRWQDFTGKEAIHIESGKTFNEMFKEKYNN